MKKFYKGSYQMGPKNSIFVEVNIGHMVIMMILNIEKRLTYNGRKKHQRNDLLYMEKFMGRHLVKNEYLSKDVFDMDSPGRCFQFIKLNL